MEEIEEIKKIGKTEDPGDCYPTHRDEFTWKSGTQWLRAKVIDDDCEGFWRIHNDLYDLSGWEKNHPGGKDWIALTKGTDCTEAFETFHVFGVSNALLQKFWVKKANGPRRYRFTFNEDGFFKTLQRRAAKVLKKVGTGPDWLSTITQDFLAGSFLLCFVLLCYSPTYPIAFLAAAFLGMSNNSAHNYFHLADKFAWRRFYFDLSFVGSREWRISHALSHHLYTNTYADLEISSVEPFLEFLPVPKGQFRRMLQHVISHVFAFVSYPASLIMRIYLILFENDEVLPEHSLPWLQLLILTAATQNPMHSLCLWLTMHCSAGYMLVIQKTTTHHGPEVYHAGDKMRTDRDWGLHTLETTRDMDKSSDTWGVFAKPLVFTTFGNHMLHHMFPAVDHSKLELLYPAFYETMKEFGEKYEYKSFKELIVDFHAQLDRTEPNLSRT
eukprot:GFUD01030884.1.p1 GENE.GFUD01030884.1~~GFUD01030884.1.p1  ORF type:complete len:449 (+),score=81.39 GFUD01030884.1:29-1348(+)